MIPNRSSVDQSFLAEQRTADPLIQRYRAFLELFEWSLIPSRDSHRMWPGPEPHPESAYIKAFLVKLCEGKPYITQLRSYLLDHPLLVIELGFRPVLDASQPLGFDLQRTIPCDRWLRFKQQYLDHSLLQDLLAATVQTLLTEIPGLGETIAVDVKHIYAWVQENNPRVYRRDRFCKDQQPTGDPDCKVGVKKSTNQVQPDGSKKVIKEYLWGYGSGIAAATNPVYGDVVLAEFTQPFNEGDVTYYLPVYRQAVVNMGFFPLNITADAAFDARSRLSNRRPSWWYRRYCPQPTRSSPRRVRPRWRAVVSQRMADASHLWLRSSQWFPSATLSLSLALSSENGPVL